jgi:hypothetical protein
MILKKQFFSRHVILREKKFKYHEQLYPPHDVYKGIAFNNNNNNNNKKKKKKKQNWGFLRTES